MSDLVPEWAQRHCEHPRLHLKRVVSIDFEGRHQPVLRYECGVCRARIGRHERDVIQSSWPYFGPWLAEDVRRSVEALS